GTPLGLVKNEKYPLRRLTLEPGGSLLLYSDVMWEEHGIPGISFIADEIAPLIKDLNGRTITTVLQERLQLLDDPSFPDDLTLMEIYRKV
ncbi:MAG: SpoIIE family protein phosphatase, partial [Alphaproteobacteria bacterium]